jgi:hypothetical protein
LTGVNPLVNARLSSDGLLTFENAAVDAGIAKPPTEYRFTLSRFDNATGAATALNEGGVTAGTSGRIEGAPRLQINAPNLVEAAFLQVSVRTIHPEYPAWATPVTFTFRRNDTQWQTVGLDRTAPAVVKK